MFKKKLMIVILLAGCQALAISEVNLRFPKDLIVEDIKDLEAKNKPTIVLLNYPHVLRAAVKNPTTGKATMDALWLIISQGVDGKFFINGKSALGANNNSLPAGNQYGLFFEETATRCLPNTIESSIKFTPSVIN